jgi:hypothetical protein
MRVSKSLINVRKPEPALLVSPIVALEVEHEAVRAAPVAEVVVLSLVEALSRVQERRAGSATVCSRCSCSRRARC